MKLRLIAIFLPLAILLAIPVKLIVDATQASQANAQENISPDPFSEKNSTSKSTQQTENSNYISNLGPNKHTPDAYIPPKYDPFNNIYRKEADYRENYPPQKRPNAKPIVKFTITTKAKGFADGAAVTNGTEQILNANLSTDDETYSSKLQVRWDFESDGKWDSFFSKTKSIKHKYQKAGTYLVTCEVLDTNGGVGRATKEVIIVNNTAPQAFLTVKETQGTPGKVFVFNTGKSSDSQSLKNVLKYHFDWDGDGIYDSQYSENTVWKHKFDKPGQYHVIMEVQDPEGLTATYYRDITVSANTPPVATFSVTGQKSSLPKQTNYRFDASASADAETPIKKLQYRWDFNYTGVDDITFDSNWSTAAIHQGHYDLPGHKIVRLQVKDEDGEISEAFQEIEA